VKIGTDAMEAALRELHDLCYSTQLASLYESYLTAKWLAAQGHYPNPNIQNVNAAVEFLFVVTSKHALGRLAPFHWTWLTREASGRKTVWNITTRGHKLATTIFLGDDLRNGLLPNAAQLVHDAVDGRPLPSWQAVACLVLRNHDFSPASGWPEARNELLNVLGLSSPDLDLVTSSAPLGPSLLGGTEWSVDALSPDLQPPKAVTVVAPPAAVGEVAAPPEEVVVDDQTKRMLLRALQNFSCVLLVGPPGTGKGALVRWAAAQVAADPAALGFSAGYSPNPIWRTPDESWSSFELIGGLAPDDSGVLRWSYGVLPISLHENRWLVLDETNRADMDKIMGPLLTWLSDQEVEIGRTTAHGGEPIVLGWGTDGDCEANADVAPTVLKAGKNWRLLGTYNPQDAQRVFRFGQALSRRFVTVPVPPLEVGQFEALLAARYPALSDDARAAITRLYSAHRSSEKTVLGPAVFLRLAEYFDPAEPFSGQLLSEAYVLSLGKYLSSYDDGTFGELRERIVQDEEAMGDPEWEWVEQQRQILS
jgi:MoxR-like ATPase